MAQAPRKILVTSALPYANGSIHLGHLLEHIQTNIWTRFQKMRGHTCYSVCADDAHGTPVMLKAQELGITPEEMVDRTRAEHHQLNTCVSVIRPLNTLRSLRPIN